MLQAEEHHRDHAVRSSRSSRTGPTAPWPTCHPGSFPANAAWLACAAIAHNLLRAAGALASLPYAKARGATIRRDLIDVAARTARHGRGHLTLHLPEGWHRETRMAEPVRRRLRAARRSGLTSPDPVSTTEGHTAAHP